MKSIVISPGHGLRIRGARGNPVPPQMDEVDEARRIVDKIAGYLRQANVPVQVVKDDVSTTQSANLNYLVNHHNALTRDLDVSVHMNCYNHTASGVEVLYVTQQSLAAEVSAAISRVLNIPNRGAKKRTDLAFLNNTEEPAVLLEVAFC